MLQIPWESYQLVLFDFDDTLVDFSVSEAAGISAVCREFKIADTLEHRAFFRRINGELWSKHNSGLMSRAEVFRQRFEVFLAELGAKADPILANEVFLSGISTAAKTFDGVHELLTELSRRCVIGIVTNGHGPTQKRRFQLSGIGSKVDFVVISDEVGFSKPDPRIFEVAVRLSNLPKNAKTLMVGDSLEADVKGGMNAGFDTCWVSRDGSNQTSVVPTYQVLGLHQILI